MPSLDGQGAARTAGHDAVSPLKSVQCEDIELGERQTVQYGPLEHLRTFVDFSATGRLEDVMAALHPTPAVGGTPRDMALDFISRHEGHDRAYYTGWVGLEEDNRVHYFVNLRCARLEKDIITAFAGGGITAGSDPDAEWRETRSKLRSLIDPIAHVRMTYGCSSTLGRLRLLRKDWPALSSNWIAHALMVARDAGVHHVVSLVERAAAHHALGMALALGRPVAVCCTSGTAAINHGPALAEADRVGLPLISLTADRPAGAADQWESQTLEQNRLHDLHVRASFTWTGVDEDGMLDRMRTALTAGPIHINCPFDEPLYPAASGGLDVQPSGLGAAGAAAADGAASALPQPVLDRIGQALSNQERILLLCGTQPLPLDAARLNGWTRSAVVAADSTSRMGAVNQTIVAVDRWMRRWTASGIPWEDMKPDLVIGFIAQQSSQPAAQGRRGPHPHRGR